MDELTSVTLGALPRTIAITGLGTFVGSQMTERLLDEQPAPRIVGLDLRLPRRFEGRLRYHRVDLTDPTADSAVAEILDKEACEAVLHAAFFTDPHADVEYSHELELIGSLHVLDGAAASGVRKIVVASTAEVYGPWPDNPNFLSEEHKLRAHPNAHSVRDRAELEGLLRLFASRHEELCVTSLRPCWIMGPTYEDRMTRHFRGRAVTTLLGFDPLMQFLHEGDWLHAVELALRSEAPGAFNLAGSGVLPLSTLLRLAGKRSLPMPHPLLYRLGLLGSLGLTGDAPPGFYDYLRFLWVVDTSRAREQLGFEPVYSTQEAWMSFVVSRRLRRYR